MKKIDGFKHPTDSFKVIVDDSFDFGKQLYKPINEMAVALAKFKGCKKFTKEQLKQLKDMGFEVELKPRSLDL